MVKRVIYYYEKIYSQWQVTKMGNKSLKHSIFFIPTVVKNLLLLLSMQILTKVAWEQMLWYCGKDNPACSLTFLGRRTTPHTGWWAWLRKKIVRRDIQSCPSPESWSVLHFPYKMKGGDGMYNMKLSITCTVIFLWDFYMTFRLQNSCAGSNLLNCPTTAYTRSLTPT